MSEQPTVAIETPLGSIHVTTESGRAPGTASRFLALVDAGAYDGGTFHRTVTLDNQPNDSIRIAVIQGTVKESLPAGEILAAPLECTSVTGLRHLDGTISLARREPDSAKSDFSICIGDQPELDFGGKRNPDGQGFAAFGRVTDGMDVVRAINQAPSDGQKLSPPIPNSIDPPHGIACPSELSDLQGTEVTAPATRHNRTGPDNTDDSRQS
jgi:peptidyl-prolyl cis-trans isomerase A (cyclophilin A)